MHSDEPSSFDMEQIGQITSDCSDIWAGAVAGELGSGDALLLGVASFDLAKGRTLIRTAFVFCARGRTSSSTY